MKRFLLILCIAVPVFAEDAEVRHVALRLGEPTSVALDEPAQFRGGDTSIIASWRNNTLTLLAPDASPRRLLFMRKTKGPLELVISVTSPPPQVSVQPQQVPRPPVRIRLVEPVRPPPIPRPPPIVAPPMPLVLRSRPVVSMETFPEMIPASPLTVVELPRVGQVEYVQAEAPRSVTERPVPLGATAHADTSLFADDLAKPAEQAIFALATDLVNRGLYGQGIDQFRRLLAEFPRTKLRERTMISIGEAYKRRAEEGEAESIRQRDLRNSGRANEALDRAIADYELAIRTFRDVLAAFPGAIFEQGTQLELAQSMHGLVRTQFFKGGAPQDSPAVIVEYLRAFVGWTDTAVSPQARLGLAQYHRDLGDARLLSRADRVSVRQSYDRAVAEYTALIEQAAATPAAEESLIDLARLFDRNLEMRRFNDAVRYYEELLTRFPGSRYADEARLRARWIKENYL